MKTMMRMKKIMMVIMIMAMMIMTKQMKMANPTTVRRARGCAREARVRFGWCPCNVGHKPIWKPNGHK